MFLRTDVIIGNLFIKAIKNGISSLSFWDIHSFFYYVHEYLSYNDTAAMIMGSNDDINKFISLYNDYFKLYGEKIDIKDNLDLLEILINNYSIQVEIIIDAFNSAFSRIFKIN